MDLKDYKPIKKKDFTGWLKKGNVALYAIILIIFAAAIVIVFSTLKSFTTNTGNNPNTQSNTESQSYSFVADNQSYQLGINKARNIVVVKKIDSKGEFSDIAKVFRCSVAPEVAIGEGKMSEKFVWKRISENVYGHYTIQLDMSGVYIHSVPYSSQSNSSLIAKAYNKLGSAADIGSVYLATADIKWIYENCGINTIVKIYEDNNENYDDRLGSFSTVAANAKFDPTDDMKQGETTVTHNTTSTAANKLLIDSVSGISDINVELNSKFDAMENVRVIDINGNDITSAVSVSGKVDTGKVGVYILTYKIDEKYGSSIAYTRKVYVMDSKTSASSTDVTVQKTDEGKSTAATTAGSTGSSQTAGTTQSTTNETRTSGIASSSETTANSSAGSTDSTTKGN